MRRSAKQTENMTLSNSKLLIALLAIACQTTDVTVGPLKLWELLALTVLPLFIKQIDRKSLCFMAYFLVILALSFLATATNTVTYDQFGLLKSKFIISLVRTAELTLCLVVTNTVFNLKNYRAANYQSFLRKFVDYNFVLLLLTLLIFLGDIALGTQLVSTGKGHRLKSFYVEGGPYGLFVATLLFLELARFRRIVYIALFATILLLTRSKAGFVLTACGLFYLVPAGIKQFKSFVDPHRRFRFTGFILFFVLVGSWSAFWVGQNYVSAIRNISREIAARPGDTSLVMGRIASLHIGYSIVQQNPLIGVGLGNYSLVRNDATYRGGFPVVKEWDLAGWGGVFNIILENGFVGLCLFIVTVLHFFKLERKNIPYLLLFLTPLLLGAQLYMVYPWVYLGFYRLSEKLDPWAGLARYPIGQSHTAN